MLLAGGCRKDVYARCFAQLDDFDRQQAPLAPAALHAADDEYADNPWWSSSSIAAAALK